jgi:3-oxoacid CoA-transferase subunit A
MRNKVKERALDVIAEIPDGASLAVGGFGACGTPVELIETLVEVGAKGLWIISNNCGTDDYGLGRLLRNGQIRRVTASYVGDNSALAKMYGAGEVELELCPQGTLAEKMRSGGSGIAAFYTKTGVGTPVALGGIPIRYDATGKIAVSSAPKPVTIFGGLDYVLEEAITADFAFVHCANADRSGNLIYNRSARNFNPLAAMCGRVTLVEAEEIVATGTFNPDHIHTPGVFVQHLFQSHNTGKRVDRLTVSDAPEEQMVML